MNSVFDQVYGVLGDVSSVNGLLDEVQTILRVDVNVTDISAGITVLPHSSHLQCMQWVVNFRRAACIRYGHQAAIEHSELCTACSAWRAQLGA